ncbi:unnamed protein product [Adineta ricciae]|uniref:Uncharacterized protein n=1 Tax=Adineta ricciae TaxID=249248 RepID=A0A815KN20_ADIRI|nr:unnamed protein product [Adineta ricciae]
MDCISERLRLNRRRDDIPDNKEDIVLIWFVESMNDEKYFKRATDRLRECNNSVLLYTEYELCMDYIRSVVTEKIILILSGKVIETIISDIQPLDRVDSIFILSTDKIQYNISLENRTKIIGNYIDINSLTTAIETRSHRILKQESGIIFSDNTDQNAVRNPDQNPGSFLLFHLLVHTLKQLPQTSDAKQQMIEKVRECYVDNVTVKRKIDEFEKDYKSSDAIQ